MSAMHDAGGKKVYLVGAGPGDPELITLKARRLLETADCVVYDHLASADLLDFVPATAERVYAGKKKSDHTLSQDEICALLVDRGQRGLNVVRLKGGDPFIFGRGGEEAEALSDAGIPFEVVPGVTSALGIAAYTGVPLTHRDHTQSVTFVTGHDVARIDWSKAGASDTLVVFMGLSHLDEICARITEGGRAPSTPAMAVRWGTRPDQTVVTGTLATLPELVRERGLKPPASIIVGDVVTLRGKLDWFGKLPLAGQSVVVTRPREQAAALSIPLRRLGARVFEIPTIEICPAPDYGPLNQAILALESYDWLVFTSANGVRFFLDRLDRSQRDLRAIRGRICVIGPATREALERFHLKVDVVAGEYVAEGLLRTLESESFAGKKVLIARAAVARDVLPDELKARGAHVDVVEAYRALPPAGLAAQLDGVSAGWITFTSSSTVQNLVDAVGVEALKQFRVASIGPVTSATLRKCGLPVSVEAGQYTVPGLVDAIVQASAQ